MTEKCQIFFLLQKDQNETVTEKSTVTLASSGIGGGGASALPKVLIL